MMSPRPFAPVATAFPHRQLSTAKTEQEENHATPTTPSQESQFIPPKEYIQMLKELADQQPNNVAPQAILIKELNKIDPKAVIERLKDARFAVNEEIVKEHIKALIKRGEFEKAPLKDIVARVVAIAGTPGALPAGTQESPLHVVMGQSWGSKLTSVLSILLTAVLIYFLLSEGRTRGVLPEQTPCSS